MQVLALANASTCIDRWRYLREPLQVLLEKWAKNALDSNRQLTRLIRSNELTQTAKWVVCLFWAFLGLSFFFFCLPSILVLPSSFPFLPLFSSASSRFLHSFLLFSFSSLFSRCPRCFPMSFKHYLRSLPDFLLFLSVPDSLVSFIFFEFFVWKVFLFG